MTKQLLLMRHAKSDWHAGVGRDFDRPLNARGRGDAPKMGEWLAQNDLIPTRMIASSSARTRETAELVLAGMQAAAGDAFAPPQVHYEERLYGGDETTIRAIAEENLLDCECALIIAHNPGMAHAVLSYCADARAFADGKLMPTCTVAVIDVDDDGGAKLRELRRPGNNNGGIRER